MTGPRSLASRLFLYTSLWAVVSISLIAWLISQNYRQTAESRMAERLTANLYNIMGSVDTGPDGRLGGSPDLRDSRFLSFNSGYYWSVSENGKPSNQIRSASLAGADIPQGDGPGYGPDFQRRFTASDGAGNRLVGIDAQVFLGQGDRLYTFRITGNRGEVDAEVSQFINRILVLLTLFALGFILATYFIVRFALRPLNRIATGLTQIREGKADRLEGDYPTEIAPLVDETNSLIRSNNAVIERARTQVGNLAHSLKTPLAVLKNEAVNAKPSVRKLIEEQVGQMQSQITTYLDRARISARTGSVTSRTVIEPAVERLLRVMRKLNPELAFELSQGPGRQVFSGEQQDFEEMLGNLLENAARFARKKVAVTIRPGQAPGRISICIDDDGPGMTEGEMARAINRGTRIDESMPGSGLGLSIVRDIVSEYQGEMRLEVSPSGGLRVHLEVPGTAS
ncbi:MAG: HAMP domain-containing histidine kinase [Nitratireductor sp.]|nr:HAMP domain-containing histidine kinase [Nitratireductor sp.]